MCRFERADVQNRSTWSRTESVDHDKGVRPIGVGGREREWVVRGETPVCGWMCVVEGGAREGASPDGSWSHQPPGLSRRPAATVAAQRMQRDNRNCNDHVNACPMATCAAQLLFAGASISGSVSVKTSFARREGRGLFLGVTTGIYYKGPCMANELTDPSSPGERFPVSDYWERQDVMGLDLYNLTTRSP